MSATITWLGHATFKLTLPDERVVVIDPWLTDNPACPQHLKTLPRCDMILLTHGHFDHVGDVRNLVESFDPPVIANFELCAVLEKQIGKGRFSGMNTGGTQVVDGVRISLTQAFHSSSVDSPNGPIYAGMPNGVIVSAGGVAKLYHMGDTDLFGDIELIAKVFDPKVVIVPIGDYFTMGACGAALAAEMLRPASIVPCHYRTFPMLAQSADMFRAALPDDLKGRLVVPEIGVELAWTQDGIG